ncbi:cytochrome P450 6a2-like isoform X2 [Cylas formicarius]|uniref:cytochrome P450 6a2-like isoform X2 n=1 Tax=Cylas formicarius TaxID=197179 RepID=UPI0029583FCD|nr:cytochrome P450 6a2-like isoform X2 [Cylas formicarius]
MVLNNIEKKANNHKLLSEVLGVKMLMTLILVFVFGGIYAYFSRSYRYWQKRGVPQLEPCFPFGDMGTVIFRRQNMGDKIKEIYDNCRARGHDYVGLYFFSRKAFLPLDPGLIKNILSKDFQHFFDRGIYYDEENDPLSAHLFSLAGPKWKTLRAKLTPAYSSGKLKFMFGTILKCGLEMKDVLEEFANRDGEIEIKEILARYSTDVIGCCAFGLECNCLRSKDAEFRAMGKRAFTQTVGDLLKMIIIRSFPALAKVLHIGVFSATVTSFFQGVVRETIEYRERNNVIRKDFMQLLIQLKNNGRIDDDGQRESQGSFR